MDIGIVSASTERRIAPDDAALLNELWGRGWSAARVAWDDPLVRWDHFDLLVVRSTWNYSLQHARFIRWVDRTSRVSSLWNRPSTLRWNTSKTYLRDLEARGIPVIPTLWFEQGSRVTAEELLRRVAGGRCVVKPVVSAGARHTFVLGPSTPPSRRRRLSRYLALEDLMVQPYLRSVETVGERGLIFLDGEYSHAIRKLPVLLRRAPRYGSLPARPTRGQLSLARRALAACPEPTLYARVDMIQDDAGMWRIGEMELTEPYLYLATRQNAVQDLASAIERKLLSAKRNKSR
jgi:hypothetical protein